MSITHVFFPSGTHSHIISIYKNNNHCFRVLRANKWKGAIIKHNTRIGGREGVFGYIWRRICTSKIKNKMCILTIWLLLLLLLLITMHCFYFLIVQLLFINKEMFVMLFIYSCCSFFSMFFFNAAAAASAVIIRALLIMFTGNNFSLLIFLCYCRRT